MGMESVAFAGAGAIGLAPRDISDDSDFLPDGDEAEARAEPAGAVVYDRFSPRVVESLGRYVYRLVDPRDDETFYVGRGVGNRIFDHMEEAEDALLGGRKTEKTDRINAIHAAGHKVTTVVHRHNLRDDDETATLEAALIEAYPNLTNRVAGEGTTNFGARAADAAIAQYDLPPAPIDKEKCLVLSLTKRWPREEDDAPFAWRDIYQRARYGWRLDVKRAEKAKYVVAQARGVVRAVFVATRWLESGDPAFAGFPRPARAPAWGFVGAPAPADVSRAWVGRRVPDGLRTRFGQRIRYANI